MSIDSRGAGGVLQAREFNSGYGKKGKRRNEMEYKVKMCETCDHAYCTSETNGVLADLVTTCLIWNRDCWKPHPLFTVIAQLKACIDVHEWIGERILNLVYDEQCVEYLAKKIIRIENENRLLKTGQVIHVSHEKELTPARYDKKGTLSVTAIPSLVKTPALPGWIINQEKCRIEPAPKQTPDDLKRQFSQFEDGECPTCGGEFGKHLVPDCDGKVEKPAPGPVEYLGIGNMALNAGKTFDEQKPAPKLPTCYKHYGSQSCNVGHAFPPCALLDACKLESSAPKPSDRGHDAIHFDTKADADAFYQAKGGKGAGGE